MRFTSLSDNPNSPCSVLQFKQATIMLDCGLDLSPLQHYLPIPPVMQARVNTLPTYSGGELNLESELRDQNGRILIDSEPEFLAPHQEFFNWADIDAILVSNYTCMLALPYITEKTGFRGKVYATEPSVLLGRLFMEEMREFLDRSPKPRKSARWKSVLRHLPPPLGDLKDVSFWRNLYTKEEMNASLARIQNVGYSEKTDCFGLLQVTAVSSGYCLGSCNWIISSGFEKIVYLSSSSSLTTHPRSMDQQSIKNPDCLILTALTQTPTQMPDPMIGDFCRMVCETLKSNGNVLVPCFPSGIIYDLLECLAGQMEMNGLTTVPLFFLSPVADSSLAYSNIMAEWLSTAKHNRVYLPEEPFLHGSLVRSGRLKSFQNLHDEIVHTEYRQPCVMFCGHPSLRFGDAVHFIQLWGAGPQNLVIFTEPSVNYLEALAPFQPLQMKAVCVPIDTSLNFTQTRKLISEVRPRCLVVPERYTRPPHTAPNRTDLIIDADVQTFKHKKLDILKLPIRRTFENIDLDPALAASLVPTEVRPGIAVATVTGNLVVKDNRYTLLPLPAENVVSKPVKKGSRSVTPTLEFPLSKQRPAHYLFGKLNATELVQKLAARGIADAKVETGPNGGYPIQIHLPAEEILIQVEETSTHVLYDQIEGTPATETERLREMLKETLLTCIAKF